MALCTKEPHHDSTRNINPGWLLFETLCLFLCETSLLDYRLEYAMYRTVFLPEASLKWRDSETGKILTAKRVYKLFLFTWGCLFAKAVIHAAGTALDGIPHCNSMQSVLTLDMPPRKPANIALWRNHQSDTNCVEGTFHSSLVEQRYLFDWCKLKKRKEDEESYWAWHAMSEHKLVGLLECASISLYNRHYQVFSVTSK